MAATDLSAAIRAKLAPWGDDPCGYATCVVVGWVETRAAIEVVLDLHRQYDQRGKPVCGHCVYVQGGDNVEWPCETVLGVARALGVEVADA